MSSLDQFSAVSADASQKLIRTNQNVPFLGQLIKSLLKTGSLYETNPKNAQKKGNPLKFTIDFSINFDLCQIGSHLMIPVLPSLFGRAWLRLRWRSQERCGNKGQRTAAAQSAKSHTHLTRRCHFRALVGGKETLNRCICIYIYIHSRELTWNLKMMVSNRKLLFQVSIFGCHVSFRGCIYVCVYIYVQCIPGNSLWPFEMVKWPEIK